MLELLPWRLEKPESTASNPGKRTRAGEFNADCSLWMRGTRAGTRHSAPAFRALMNHDAAPGTSACPLNAAVICYGGSPAMKRMLAGRMPRGGSRQRFALLPARRRDGEQNAAGRSSVSAVRAGSRGAEVHRWRGVCGCATRATPPPRGNRCQRSIAGPDPTAGAVTMKWNTSDELARRAHRRLPRAKRLARQHGGGDTAENNTFASVCDRTPAVIRGVRLCSGDAHRRRTIGFLYEPRRGRTLPTAEDLIVSSGPASPGLPLATYGASAAASFSGPFGGEWGLYARRPWPDTTAPAAATRGRKLHAPPVRSATIATAGHPAIHDRAGDIPRATKAFMAAGL